MKWLRFIAFFAFFAWAARAHAQEISSDNFRIPASGVGISEGGEMTSASFRLKGTVQDIGPGIVSGDSFTVSGGIVPVLTDPTTSAASSPSASETATGGGGLLGLGEVIGRLLVPKTKDLPLLTRTMSVCGVGDFSCDDAVDLADLSAFLYLTGFAATGNPADFNQDGRVDLADASILFASWSMRVSSVPSDAGIPTSVSVGRESKDIFIFGSPRVRVPPRGIQHEGRAELLGATQQTSGVIQKFWDAIRKILDFFGVGADPFEESALRQEEASLARSLALMADEMKDMMREFWERVADFILRQGA